MAAAASASDLTDARSLSSWAFAALSRSKASSVSDTLLFAASRPD